MENLAHVRPASIVDRAGQLMLAALALLIHFILLSTNKYNWIEGSESQDRLPHAVMLLRHRRQKVASSTPGLSTRRTR